MSHLTGLSAAATLGLFPNISSACSVCMGDPNSRESVAINAAVFLMLGFIGAMLSGLVAFGVCLMKRANSQLASHGELVDSENSGD